VRLHDRSTDLGAPMLVGEIGRASGSGGSIPWQVFGDHRIEEDHLCDDTFLNDFGGHDVRWYFPTLYPNLASETSKLGRATPAQIVKHGANWGKLGYFAQRDIRTLRSGKAMEQAPVQSDPLAEPLGWIRGHGRTVDLALELIAVIADGDGDMTANLLKSEAEREGWGKGDAPWNLTDPQIEWTDANYDFKWGLPLPLPRYWIDQWTFTLTSGWASLWLPNPELDPRAHLPEFWLFVGKLFLNELIAANLRRAGHRLFLAGAGFDLGIDANSLIEVVWWHVARVAAGQVGRGLRRCKECEHLFIVTDGRQQFCPHPTGTGESLCGDRNRKKPGSDEPREGEE
jgi:hypothetical protein